MKLAARWPIGSHARAVTPASTMRVGVQRRLLLLLLVPLAVFALINVYFDYRAAGDAALQKDVQLSRLIPLLADSILSPATHPGPGPILLLAPAVQDFIRERPATAGFRISDSAGEFLAGETWISSVVPATRDAEFHSEQINGRVYRLAAQRIETPAGLLILQLADGSDARQQWPRSLLLKVILPNVILLLVAGLAVNWAVSRALRPLLALKEAVARRNPRDLSAIDSPGSPAEVEPLVNALNRLFERVNNQAENQRRFVADAAHQLRTPLAGLQAQVEAWAVTARGAAQPDVTGADPGGVTIPTEAIFKLRDATRRTSQLANQLLALSRADASTSASAPLQRIDLKGVCETAFPLHLDAAAARAIDLGLEAESAWVDADDCLLRELLCNLLNNAAHSLKMQRTACRLNRWCRLPNCLPNPNQSHEPPV